MGDHDLLAGKFYDALVAIDRVHAAEIAAEAASDGLAFIESAVVPALVRIGTDWEEGKIALSQVYLGSRIAEAVVDGILPATAPKRRRPALPPPSASTSSATGSSSSFSQKAWMALSWAGME